MSTRRRIFLTATAAGIAVLAPLAATGRSGDDIRTVNAISPQEKAQGAKAHPELLAEFGGRYAGPQAAYVTSVGRKIASQSSLSSAQGDFTVTLLDSSVNNAFAIPGGYIYITRQLTALMNDEAELAGVLGHEVGHVAAQHSKRRQDAAQRNNILGAIGGVLAGAVAGNSGLGGLIQRGIGTGAQLLTLRFSRAQEYEADDLGIRYLTSAGYDPRALSNTLASLADQTSLDAQISGSNDTMPAWASTHPDPASRVSRALQTAQATRSTSTVRNADVFLTNIDGMTYGDDPKQGIVDGSTFIHPGYRLKFTAPRGFAVANGNAAVSVTGSGGQAQFSSAAYRGDLESYVSAAFAKIGGDAGGSPAPRRTSVNGIDAAYATARASTRQGPVDVTIFAYAFTPTSAYHFVILTPAGSGIGPFDDMVGSVTRLTAAEAAAIKLRRVRIVTVKAGDTVQSLSARMAYPDYRSERFLVLNGLRGDDSLDPGDKVKIITY